MEELVGQHIQGAAPGDHQTIHLELALWPAGPHQGSFWNDVLLAVLSLLSFSEMAEN